MFFFKSVNIRQSYKQERGCLMHFARLANTLLDTKKAQETITFLNVLLITLSNFATENTADPAAARTSITRPCRG